MNHPGRHLQGLKGHGRPAQWPGRGSTARPDPAEPQLTETPPASTSPCGIVSGQVWDDQAHGRRITRATRGPVNELHRVHTTTGPSVPSLPPPLHSPPGRHPGAARQRETRNTATIKPAHHQAFLGRPPGHDLFPAACVKDASGTAARTLRAPVTRPARSQNPAAIKGQGEESGRPQPLAQPPVDADKAVMRVTRSLVSRASTPWQLSLRTAASASSQLQARLTLTGREGYKNAGRRGHEP